MSILKRLRELSKMKENPLLLKIFAAFRSKIKEIKRSAFSTIRQLQSEGMHIIGYGGRYLKHQVLLIFLELTVQDIPFTLDMDPI